MSPWEARSSLRALLRLGATVCGQPGRCCIWGAYARLLEVCRCGPVANAMPLFHTLFIER